MPILTAEERVGGVLSGRYRIESELGRGGMGVVFAGKHELTGRPIAIKLLLPGYAQDDEVLARFFQEARAAAALNHPNVVDVLDMGEDGDDAFLILELLEGSSLARLIKERGRIPIADLLRWTLPIIDAVAAANDAGIIHRDLKPDNLFIHRDVRGREIPKVLDFGVAKLIEMDSSVQTRTGGILGTPHYMSPEQAQGQRDIGVESDVWSMGVLLYESLTGERPFQADSVPALLLKICTYNPVRLEECVPDLDPRVAEVIHRAFSLDPELRISSMEQLGSSLLAAGIAAELELGNTLGSLFPPAVKVVEPMPKEAGRVYDAPRSSMAAAATIAASPKARLKGERGSETPAPASRAPVIALVAAVLCLLGVVGWVSSGDDVPTPPETEAQVPAPPPQPEPVAPPEPVPPEPVAPEPNPRVVPEAVVRILSEPEGAQVWLDGTHVGETPFPIEMASFEGEERTYQVRHPGHRRQSVSIAPDTTSDVVVSLRRQPRPGGSIEPPNLAPR